MIRAERMRGQKLAQDDFGIDFRMENAGYIALSRQTALTHQLEVIANNLANMTTPAYKAQTLQFGEYLMQADRAASLSFVQESGITRNWAEGAETPTGNPLDVAIHGDGFFVVSTPEGERYTRKGRFELDANGQLVTVEGYAVQGDRGPITIPAEDGEVTISEDGTVSNEQSTLGNIRLVRFTDPNELQAQGFGLYQTSAPALPADESSLVQGMVEDSNVNPILEMTALIQVTRDYQATQKMLETEHERSSRAISSLVGNA